ncbi:MAG: polyhydroxyalkanoate synthesis repressor PhaR [Novosphingobium sp.]
MAANDETSVDPIIIKKYANRRLYNTSSSSYITLEDLARMTREGVDFQVLDAKTGKDITHQILTQIIMDEETNGEQLLPVGFLRQLISMYGNSMQAMMPHYLEASMDNFLANQKKVQQALSSGVGENPLAKLAQTNLAMFKAAAAAMMPGAKGEESGANDGEESELDSLRAQMEEMKKKLDSLGK